MYNLKFIPGIATSYPMKNIHLKHCFLSELLKAPRYKCLSRMSRRVQQLRDHDINPCVVETDASRKCMDDNNYNKDMCTAYFLKYKNCRKFWHDIMMQRRRNGVKPEMPSPEERRKILESMGKPY